MAFNFLTVHEKQAAALYGVNAGINRPSGGRTYWVKKSTDADYSYFYEDKIEEYDDGSVSIYNTVQAAVTAASAHDHIYVVAGDISASGTDPTVFAENVIIPAGKSFLTIEGVGAARNNAGPQIKKGSGTAAQLIIRSPGCTILNMGISGSGATGGGISLEDDASTMGAFGTTIMNCYFRKCAASGAANFGGAIQWVYGGAWNCRVSNCLFFDCRGGISVMETSTSRPQDIVIEDCVFTSAAKTTIDCDIYMRGLIGGTAGCEGVCIRRCTFCTVDVPAYAGAGNIQKYLELTGCEGMMEDCTFACTGKTFGDNAGVNAGKIPATFRFANCYQEDAIITRTS